MLMFVSQNRWRFAVPSVKWLRFFEGHQAPAEERAESECEVICREGFVSQFAW
jgi:hypothetical protein